MSQGEKCSKKRKRKSNVLSLPEADEEEVFCETRELDTRPHKPRIVRIRFGILSAEEIERMSTVSITEPSIFDRTVPKPFGVNDLRMGSIDRRYRCGTCGESIMGCVGHSGCIDLAFPVYHISFMPTVAKILSCVCFFCCTLLIDLSDLSQETRDELLKESSPKSRFPKITKFKKLSICPNPTCSGPQPHYSSVIGMHEIGIKVDWKDAIAKYGKHIAKASSEIDNPEEFRNMYVELNNLAKRPFTGADAAHILTGIDKATCTVLGFDFYESHPRNMILSKLYVPAPIIRPAAMTSEGRARNHDDLTEKLRDIVSANEALKTAILSATNGECDCLDSTSYILQDKYWSSVVLIAIRELQYQVSVLFNNDVRGLRTDRQRSGAATKSICSRLKGKEGRFRNNVCGKRVNFSARSVITPDPNIDLDQLGVPHHVAITLSFPERVNRWNIEKLMARVQNGADRLDGARNLIQLDGTHYDLKHTENRERIQLRYGDIVERYLENDDIGVFNRQPSLHKQSMMGHRIVIMPHKTFRLNPAVVTPYNADFDGDEMNLHILQSYEGQVEARELMSVNKNIISPKASKPCIGLIQDFCLGAYFLTKRDVFFRKADACQLLSQCVHLGDYSLPPPAILKPVTLWTGKQLVSRLFPKTLFYKRWRNEAVDKKMEEKHCNPFDNLVLIDQGELRSGILCKETLGTTSGSIHHMLCRLLKHGGNDVASRFISDIQRMVNWYLMNRGFSIGIRDNITTPEVRSNIKNMQDTLMHKVSTIYEKMMDEEGFKEAELEADIYGLLRKGLSITSAIADKQFDDKNAIWAMVHSGSKGNPVNIGQMTASLGQQSLEGKRISGRPLPGFPENDRNPASRGYVRNSLYDGLTTTEFFEHAIGGREGLVDTAVKTALTGCLMQAMNDIVVEQDGTVRKSNGEIVQSCYGADGWDANFLVRVFLNDLDMDLKSFVDKHLSYTWRTYKESLMPNLFRGAAPGGDRTSKETEKKWKTALSEEIALISDLHVSLQTQKKSILQGFGEKSVETLFQPVNIEEELYALEHQHRHCVWKTKSDFGIHELRERTTKILQKLHEFTGTNESRDYYILTKLCTKEIFVKRHMSLDIFDALEKIILQRYRKAIVEANEMVGSLAAESLGEPCTQMSLIRSERVIIKIKNEGLTNSPVSARSSIKYGTIGDIIDGILEVDCKDGVELGESRSVLAHPTEEIEIMTINRENEKTEWRKITEVSRHPVNGKLVKVQTRSKREITTTLSHSHLARTSNGKIIPKIAKELKTGDRIPVNMRMNSDILYDQFTICGKGDIKDTFLLDFSNGWMVGAYLAEGDINITTLRIANISKYFENRTRHFCDRFGGKMKIQHSLHKITEKYPEYPFTVYLVNHIPHIIKFLLESCGTGSLVKRVPGYAYFAPLEFVAGILRGYFDGDGNVNAERQLIRVHSINESLLEQMALLLSRFGIFGSFTKEKLHDKNPLYAYIILRKQARLFMEKIGSDFSEKLEAMQKIIEYNERDDIVQHKEYIDKIPAMGGEIARVAKPLKLPGYSRNYGRWERDGKKAVGRKTLAKYEQIFRNRASGLGLPVDLSQIQQAINSDVIWDEIVKIEIIDKPEKDELVYDFGVEGNNTFMIQNGIFVHNTLNTFHSAGQGARVVTSGIPRVKELLFMSKKIKTPSTTIFVCPEVAKNESFLFRWANLLKELFLEDVLIPESVEILWDPDPSTTISTNKYDITLVRIHSIFYEKTEEPYTHSRWVIRARLDKNALVDRGLIPKDIARVIRRHMNISKYSNVVIASETHMEDWILRFRIPDVYHVVQESSSDETTRQIFEKDLCLRILYELSRTIRISGIAGIKGATVRQELGHTIIDTKGSNMLDLWMLDGLDWTKTVSNVLYEVQEYLGIEAATEMLFYELKSVMTMASANISERHLLVLMDVMTRNGYLLPINRHGFNRLNHALARAAFEETVENLMEAAMFAEVDPMRDIVSNLAVGQMVPAGTGRVHTLLTEDYVRDAQLNMSQMMPVKEDQIISTQIHVSMRDVIETSQKSENNKDPLADWIAPQKSDLEDDIFFQSQSCTNETQSASLLERETQGPGLIVPGSKNPNRRFATYSYFLETEENISLPFERTSEGNGLPYKIPAYRPSSPKSSDLVEGLPVKTRSYRPSSPPSSQDCHLSPRGRVGDRSQVSGTSGSFFRCCSRGSFRHGRSRSLEASSLQASSLQASSLEASSLEASSLQASSLEASSLEARSLQASSLEASFLEASSLGESHERMNDTGREADVNFVLPHEALSENLEMIDASFSTQMDPMFTPLTSITSSVVSEQSIHQPKKL